MGGRLRLAVLTAGLLAGGVHAGTTTDVWDLADAEAAARYTADLVAATCPTRAWVEGVNRYFPAGIAFEHDPSASSPGGCPGDAQHSPLTRLEAKVYQSLHIMRRYLGFDAPLPWTSSSLWDWFHQSVLGIVFTDEPHSWCCDPSGRIHVAVDGSSALLAPWGDSFIAPGSSRGLHEFIGLLVHEARHANGQVHSCSEGTDDATLGEVGAWAAERYLFAWWADHSASPSFWTAGRAAAAGGDQTLAILRARGEALCRSGGRFCQDACPIRPLLAAGDYDGDGRADPTVYRYANQAWYVNRTALGPFSQRWGRLSDTPVPADYDGDGRTDLAVYRAADSSWHVFQSAGGRIDSAWGVLGDVPVPADYDGDGRADLAVWRPSDGSWHIQPSGTDDERVLEWGAHEWASWVPAPADYDGDGAADPAAFHPSTGTWRIAASRDALLVRSLGTSGDLPVPADYDGDGRADVAVWRPSEATWYLSRSALGDEVVTLGQAGDLPVFGRFDVDLLADLAVFRPATGTWIIRNSTGTPARTTFRWGRAGDVPQ